MTAPKLTVAEVQNAIGPIEGFAYNGHGGARTGPFYVVTD
jgi:hypothetical protein